MKYYFFSSILFINLINPMASSAKIIYPEAPKCDTVTDNYFGTIVKDPYRPLENDTSALTTKWVKQENAVTRAYLDAIPFRNKIRSRLSELFNYKKTGLPWRGNDGKLYFYDNDGLQNQSTLFRCDSLNGAKEVFLDPNKLSNDGTVALTNLQQNDNGTLTSYTIARNGSDWNEIYVMDTKSKQLLPDHIKWAKFSTPQWWGDGFFYSAYPQPENGKEFSNANEGHQIFYHKIGTDQSLDSLYFSDAEHPLHFHTAYVPTATDLLFVIGSGEGFGESLMMKDLSKPDSEWVILEPSQDIEISPVGVIDNKLYILTSYNAEHYRLMAADLNNPQRENWIEIIPESDNVLCDVEISGKNLITTYMVDASHRAYIHDASGKLLNEIQLPGYGTTSFWASKKYPDEIYYSFTSFTSPTTRYSYNKETSSSELIGQTSVADINFDDYVTEQVFYTSLDGTKIPMFITHKKGIKLDGKNPTLLYGYGGFNISLTPGFSSQRMLWLENGGVYAQPSLRGGGEYGEKWHKAGTQLNKINVFNDFIAAAEYLIEKGYTSPDQLAIQGGSNGGLLVGATVNMRPDLFKVAIPQVGVMDMMRYHLFTIGWNWASDYGTSSDSKQMADYLLSYSPIHTIKNDGTPYPAILVTTADHDDRVVPAHSFKYAAQLQHNDTGNAPKLIRIDSNAGHGAGKPTSKIIDEQTDIYSFIMFNLRKQPK